MTPIKPFDTYKWRWLSVQPSEGLLEAPVFLGVLRALGRHEGRVFADPRLKDTLQIVQEETESSVTLARDPSRNLFRNSGQYWRGTGLLTSARRGLIQLTPLGRRVADGYITQAEFAALMVQQTMLPNVATYSSDEIDKWREANLEIRPLKLILEIIEKLGRNSGASAAYLTNEELVKVVIPLAGAKASVDTIASMLFGYRADPSIVHGWPDCAPMDNDRRLAREFLLFLANFGLLRLEAGAGVHVSKQKFVMDELFDVESVSAPSKESIFEDDASAARAVDDVRHSSLPSIIERTRVMTTVLARTGQSKFRSRVLNAYERTCFITGEKIPEILEAAHIVPVKNGGSDDENNGICLRIDIHRLFDSGNIRLRIDGSIMLSDNVASSANYGFIPEGVTYPPFINPANIAWRDNYL
ncbi:HNH endonuclease [Asticcacaulis machinosus]|uniref:HNH endonuclease signature motif containing protein n=1 Tax=Asticcacaulis machinosus TaxID=2984211 RepID=A0ABT5HGE1_9CAUL|nr:HNH endonuclease signature motif containing protein [Asticcacaulis machinosus]MDC7674694.1 HNH endonuclease signature motif containing protein [Asticcacaulis machinosus]